MYDKVIFLTCLLFCQVLKLDLKEIREQQDLLFRFMSFLKEEGAVHVLQFCLTVGEDMYFTANINTTHDCAITI